MAIPPRRSVQPKPPVADPAPPASGPGAATPGTPVNPFSRAVHPRLQYPRHFDFLMRDLYDQGMVPEQWQVVTADEVRLDENGMDIEFTLLEPAVNRLWRRRVCVEGGKLVRISDG
jgi:hypothetical protein